MPESANSHGLQVEYVREDVRNRLVECATKIGCALSRYETENGTGSFVWFLGEGSLLGAYRLGGMLPKDYDVDISILYPNISLEQARVAMTKLYHWLKPELQKVGLRCRYMNRFDVSAKDPNDEDFQPGQHKDKIYVFDPSFGIHEPFTEEDDWYKVSIDVQLMANCPKDPSYVRYAYCREDANIEEKVPILKELIMSPSEGLSRITFEGRDFPAPRDIEGFLKALYGYIGKNAVFDSETCQYKQRTADV